jgi:hypothetical protein
MLGPASDGEKLEDAFITVVQVGLAKTSMHAYGMIRAPRGRDVTMKCSSIHPIWDVKSVCSGNLVRTRFDPNG